MHHLKSPFRLGDAGPDAGGRSSHSRASSAGGASDIERVVSPDASSIVGDGSSVSGLPPTGRLRSSEGSGGSKLLAGVGGLAKTVGGGALKGVAAVGGGALKGVTMVGEGALKGVTMVGDGALKGVTAVGDGALKGVTAVGGGALKGVTVVGGGALKGVTAVGGGALKVGGGVAKLGVGGLTSGFKGVMSSGRGFREFLLKGPVVELAVAVVVGMAFTDLVNRMVESFITPLIAAIFRGVSFKEMYFTINGSQFLYGVAINAIIVFLLVLAFTYWGIMKPLQHFTAMFYPNRVLQKDCPRCFSEIPMRATRCKFCTAEMEVTPQQEEKLAAFAEAHKLFSGKGIMGCAPCMTAGKAAVKYGREASDVVLKRTKSGESRLASRLSRRAKSASNASSGKLDNGSEADVEAGGKAANGDASGGEGGAGGSGIPQEVVIVTVDERPADAGAGVGAAAGRASA